MLLGVVAMIFLLIAVLSGFVTFDTSQAERNARVLRDFKRIERFVLSYEAQASHMPGDDDVRSGTASIKFEDTWNELISIKAMPVRYCTDELDPFKPSAEDRFVLLVWRGEFYSCYASPSGETTLITDPEWWLQNNLRTVAPVGLAALLLGGLTSWTAFRLYPRRPNRKETQAASSS